MTATADAPGHLVVLGSEGPSGLRLALPLPLRIRARVRPVDDGVFRARTLVGSPATPEFSVPFDALLPATGPPDYASVRALLGKAAGGAAGARVLGAFVLLGRERKAVLDRAASVEIDGDLPSDPAWGFDPALEVASLKAILRAYGARLSDRETARLALRVERLIAGGEGDLGERLAAVCAPPESVLPIEGEEPGRPVPIPRGLAFLVLANANPSPEGPTDASGKRAGGEEEARARSFLENLRRFEQRHAPDAPQALGRLLRESHASLAAGGRTDPACDELVAALARLGSGRGVLGARASGRSRTSPLVALVGEGGDAAVREFLATRKGFLLACRVPRG